jgi:hypothetical protein
VADVVRGAVALRVPAVARAVVRGVAARAVRVVVAARVVLAVSAATVVVTARPIVARVAVS